MAAASDEIWYVYDASLGWSDADEANIMTFDRPVQILANKSDLGIAARTGLAVSALTREGLDSLVRLVASRLSEVPSLGLSERHVPHVEKAAQYVLEAIATLRSARPVDLAVVTLQAGLSELGMVTGETANADIIDRIFHDFCIGK